MKDKFIHINGNGFVLPNKYVDLISNSKELLDDIENEGLVFIDSEEKALRWCFLEDINAIPTLVVSDIIDISNIYKRIKKTIRVNKINDILK